MKSLFLDKKIVYDGSQLRSLFGYLDHKVQGDSVISWIGPCDVSLQHMVDGEDLLAGEEIAGDEMVHFVIEMFGMSLAGAVAVQRLFASICMDLMREHLAASASTAPSSGATRGAAGDASPAFADAQLWREGDDIYFARNAQEAEQPGKMSISIATLSPMSALVHFAVNVTNSGTPVKTASLGDLKFDASKFAQSAMAELCAEYNSIQSATTKVRWVR